MDGEEPPTDRKLTLKEVVHKWAAGEKTLWQLFSVWLRQKRFSSREHRTIILLLILSCVAIWNLRGCQVSSARQERDNARQERDKYFQALQPWQALAARLYTNEPSAQRLEKLYEVVTNAATVLEALDPSRRKVGLIINGVEITQSSRPEVQLSKDRTLAITIQNKGGLTVDNVGIGIGIPLAATNIVARGWHHESGFFEMKNGRMEQVKGIESWTDDSKRSIVDGGFYEAGPVTISTNFQGPGFVMVIDVTAGNGPHQRFNAVIILPVKQ